MLPSLQQREAHPHQDTCTCPSPSSVLLPWSSLYPVTQARNPQTLHLFSVSAFTYILYAKLLQSCLTLCEPLDCSPPGFSVYGILQARILEWVAMPSSRGSSWTQGSNPPLLQTLPCQMGSLPLIPPGKASPCFTPSGLIGKDLLICGLQILNESDDTGFSFACSKIFIIVI